MTFHTQVGLMLVASAVAHGQIRYGRDDRRIIVAMQRLDGPIPAHAHMAQKLASGMFAKIGVHIAWSNWPDASPDAIQVTFSYNTPESVHPTALAYSQGNVVVILFDRIRREADGPTPLLITHLLAHVLAHELTHVLQGVNRHSATGLMKAHWNTAEVHGMIFKPLEFTPEDIALIHAGISRRAEQIAPLVARR